MANASETDNDFRYFIKKLLTLFVADFELPTDEVPPEMPSPHSGIVTDELIEKFMKALWFKAKVANFAWYPFFKEYALDIFESHYSYVSSVLYMCQVTYRAIGDKVFECFTCIIAAVAVAAVFSFQHHGQTFASTAPILMTYFDKVLKTRFYQSGGWRGLLEYISLKYYLKWYSTRNSTDPKVMTSFRDYLLDRVKDPDYHASIEYIIPDHVKQDSLCTDLTKEVMKCFFPEQFETLAGAELNLPEIKRAMENLSLSQSASLEAPMKTTDSGAGPSTSGIDVVQTSKEYGHPTQASVSGAQAIGSSTSQISGQFQDMGEMDRSSQVGTLSPRAQDPEKKSLFPDYHSTCPHREVYPFIEIPAEAADSGSQLMYDLERLVKFEKSTLLRARSVLHDLKCDTVTLSVALHRL